MSSKPKFQVDQVVLCTAGWYEYVRIAAVYRGRTHYRQKKLRQLYVIAAPAGRSTTATEGVLRALTAKEIGPRRARTTAPKRKSPVARKRSNKNSGQKGTS